MLRRRRPGWSRDDRALRIAMLIGAVLGVLLGGASAEWGVFAVQAVGRAVH